MEAKAVSSATTGSSCQLAVFPAPFDMTETRHPDGSDLDNRHRFGARARHAGDSPTAVCTGDIKALARSLRSKLQARVYQAWIFYRKASAKGSSEIAARSPGMVVVGAVVAPTRARAFPVIYPATQIGNGSCLPIASGPWARSGRRSSTLLRRSCDADDGPEWATAVIVGSAAASAAPRGKPTLCRPSNAWSSSRKKVSSGPPKDAERKPQVA
jgi:hypothetical protein